jgi:PST family polysaccharide transporter
MTQRPVVVNSAWLIADKVMRLGLGLLVWVWLARYFGPATFGVWNYAMAFAALYGAVTSLGLDGIVVRELARDNADAGAIMGTVLGMRLVAAVIAAAAAIGAAASSHSGEWLPVLLVALNCVVFILQSSQVLDFHFQARMRARPSVLAGNVAFLFTTIARLVLLAMHAPIEWFGVSLVFECALSAFLLCRAYRADTDANLRWRFDLSLGRKLLRESWPLLLSGMAVMLYMRLDQVMLAAMVGEAAVGQFAAALRLAEVWYFIPAAIMTAAFPVLIKKKAESAHEYQSYIQSLYDGMAWLGLSVAVTTSLMGPWIVRLLYGPEFAEAAGILAVQAWAGVAVAMSYVHGRWLLAEGLQKYNLLYTLIAASTNVALNLVLIPRYGAIGAAWATLAAQTGPILVQLLFPRTRRNFIAMIRTVAAPYRMWRLRAFPAS